MKLFKLVTNLLFNMEDYITMYQDGDLAEEQLLELLGGYI
jgi:hypothetical protein